MSKENTDTVISCLLSNIKAVFVSFYFQEGDSDLQQSGVFSVKTILGSSKFVFLTKWAPPHTVPCVCVCGGGGLPPFHTSSSLWRWVSDDLQDVAGNVASLLPVGHSDEAATLALTAYTDLHQRRNEV